MELAKQLPEIEKIKDQDLKGKVIATWEEAIKLGGWSQEDLKEVPFTLLIPDCPASLIEHTRAVTNTALMMAVTMKDFYGERVKIDFDILVAGGLLHDVGKLLEYSRSGGKISKSKSGRLLRHPFSGANLAYKNGLPDEVVHIIATHAHEGDGGYRSVEAILINHADFANFESLGGKV